MALEPGYEIDIRNIALGDALSERSILIPNAKRIQFGCRDSEDNPVSFRFSNVSNGTINGPYINMFTGSLFFEGDLKMSQRFYFSSKTPNAIMEVFAWR